MKCFYDQMKFRKVDTCWFYVEGDNANAIQVYQHWGAELFSNLKIFCADFVRRTCEKNQQTMSIPENISYFSEKLADLRWGLHSVFGSKDRLLISKLEIRLLETKDLANLEMCMTSLCVNFRNVLNSKWKHLNLEGLKSLLNPENTHKGYSISILHEEIVIGVVTILRDFSPWRAGFSVWCTGLYIHPHFNSNLCLSQILKATQLFFITKVSTQFDKPESSTSMTSPA